MEVTQLPPARGQRHRLLVALRLGHLAPRELHGLLQAALAPAQVGEAAQYVRAVHVEAGLGEVPERGVELLVGLVQHVRLRQQHAQVVLRPRQRHQA